ncbi:MAG: hypothetical protein ACOC91_02000 [bacterium]
MTALAADRNTPEKKDAAIREPGVAAGAVIYAGALVVLNSGWAEPGSTALDLTAIGRAEEQVDNTGGANGDKTVRVRRGVFRFVNDGGDPVAAADIGSDCYIVDDQTVAKTDGTGTRSVAGKVYDVDAQGVWVEIDRR